MNIPTIAALTLLLMRAQAHPSADDIIDAEVPKPVPLALVALHFTDGIADGHMSFLFESWEHAIKVWKAMVDASPDDLFTRQWTPEEQMVAAAISRYLENVPPPAGNFFLTTAAKMLPPLIAQFTSDVRVYPSLLSSSFLHSDV